MNRRTHLSRVATLATLPLLVTAAACEDAGAPPANVTQITALVESEAPRRRVWDRAGDYASVDPAGRSVTWVDWSTGDVAVHDLQTGEDRRVTDTGGWAENGSWAEFPIFSPDGTRIAYSYGNVLAADGDDAFLYQLRVVGADGSDDRLIFGFDGDLAGDRGYVWPLAWSDRHGIVYGYATPDESALMIVEPASGDSRRLASLDMDLVSTSAAVSPDQSRAAFVFDGRLASIDLESGRFSPSSIGANTVFGWSGPDAIVFRGADGTSSTAMRVRMSSDGFDEETVEPLMPGLRYATAGGQAGDRFFYSLPVESPRLFVASLGAAGEGLLSPPSPITEVSLELVETAEWSPDGSRIAYATRDPARVARILVQSPDGSDLLELAALDQTRRALGLEWASDGESLYLNRINDAREHELLEIDAVTGRVEILFSRDEGPGTMKVTPDGRWAVGVVTRDGSQPRDLLRVDLQSGEQTVLAAIAEGWENIEISPDGTTIAVVGSLETRRADSRNAIWLFPIAGGEGTRLDPAMDDPDYHIERGGGMIDWVGDEILVTAGMWDAETEIEGANHWVEAYPVDGGAPRRIGLDVSQQGFWRPVFSNDGRRVALVEGGPRSEFWMMSF